MSNVYHYNQNAYLAPVVYPQPTAGIQTGVGEAEPKYPGVLALVVALYLVSTALLSSAVRYNVSWLPQAIAVGVFPAWLVFGLAQRRPLVLSKPIMLYLAWTVWACSGLLVPGTGIRYQTNLITLSKVVAITWLCTQCVRSRSDLLFCLLVLSLSAIAIYVEGADAIIKSAAYRGESEVGRVSVGATLIGNANGLAITADIFLLGNLTCFLAARRLIAKLFSLIPVPFVLYLIAASGSRTGLIGLLFIAIGTYWFHFRKIEVAALSRKLGTILMGILIAAGAIYFVVNSPFFFRLAKTFSSKEEAMKQPRFVYTLVALQATARAPIFGLGLGGFASHALSGIKAHYSHSTVAEVAVCTGLPGFFIYFGGQLAFYLLIRRARNTDLPPQDKTVANMMMVLFFALQFFNLVSVNYFDRLIWPLTGAICGYLEYLRRRYASESAHPVPH